MNLLQAIILGIVEGLTEYLPVSSTGHLILTQALMGIEKSPAVDAYLIVIQLGAILAVLALYKQRVREMIRGVLGRDKTGLALFLKIMTAFVPAAAMGLLFEEWIESKLFGPAPVAAALIAGGILMIAVERWEYRKTGDPRDEATHKTIDSMTFLDAVVVGLMQCLSLWPGMSRSMSTIVGAQLRGMSTAAAAEFSFLLALPTLGGATCYKLLKNWEDLEAMENGLGPVLTGNVVAFIVAAAAVWGFVSAVKRFGMSPFGVYRIIIGVVVLAALAMGWLG